METTIAQMEKMKIIVQQHRLRPNQITKRITLCRHATTGCSNALTIAVFRTGGNVMGSMVRHLFCRRKMENYKIQPIHAKH